jgi:hypothetical protein
MGEGVGGGDKEMSPYLSPSPQGGRRFFDCFFIFGENVFKEEPMGEIVHTSRIKIVRERGPTRRAMIEGFDKPVYYGVHGGIKRFYKIEPEEEHAATLDHIVAATAG